eukprot:snap_masked-scaffold_15-processed-gene-4.47-mRNA-1 protein AED:1.00 eAED:1.00 QI:0/-1/0/0/-1/1/1/0/79
MLGISFINNKGFNAIHLPLTTVLSLSNPTRAASFTNDLIVCNKLGEISTNISHADIEIGLRDQVQCFDNPYLMYNGQRM